MLTCNYCQKFFKPKKTNNNNPSKYCSRECYNGIHARKSIRCAQCNNETKNPKFCNRSCSALFTNLLKGARTDEDKAKISKSLKGYGSKTSIQYCSCEICNIQFLWNSISRGSKRCCTDANCVKQFRYNTRKGKTGGFRKNSTRVHRSIYKNQQMDSGAELAFAQLLDKNNIDWIKNSTTSFEYLPGKKYYPDFYLPAHSIWIEIKGKKYVRDNDDLRWKSVPNLEVIWSYDIKLPKFVAGNIGNDPT